MNIETAAQRPGRNNDHDTLCLFKHIIVRSASNVGLNILLQSRTGSHNNAQQGQIPYPVSKKG